eukprot:sb/3474369/
MLPKSRECKVEQKKFYFDVGRNDRGVFLRLTEAKNNLRQNITIPRSGWKTVRDVLTDFCAYDEGKRFMRWPYMTEYHQERDSESHPHQYDKCGPAIPPAISSGNFTYTRVEWSAPHVILSYWHCLAPCIPFVLEAPSP